MRLRLLLAVLLVARALPGQDEAQAGGLAYFYAAPRGASGALPALVLLPGGAGREAAQAAWNRWHPQVAGRGWCLAAPAGDTALVPGSDASVQAAEAVFEDLRKRCPVDEARVYLAGEQEGASAALYLAARRPDLWTAALAMGGSPRAAIESNRLFAANTQLVPVLWNAPSQEAAALEPLRARLLGAGYNLERATWASSPQQALEWLAGHRREPFPAKVDCEAGSLEFARCYWVELTKLDPARRNDVLGTTRVAPGSGASLALGGFGFNPSLPGPGVVIGWLPQNYQGPLRPEDRILTVGGKEIVDGLAYVNLMDQLGEEGRVAVMILRGKERLRIETRIVLPKRQEIATARVQAEFLPDAREVQIISRGAAELRLNLPAYWTPAPVTWNGREAGRVEGAGCWRIREGGRAERCAP